ncbi:MAG: DUF4105 domain-containing protein [Gemmatimonadetes bacterium]|nr:DUF4105 domain-containing protein [Gemmatimonadota bacterium]NIR78068.1 DUF4105 domain-containing protein [Gemmatimonadota bacterium]NIT86635.1 DUF4105 domain-containing protein [Gemmatimonadota bacterium]NIU30488.1 DUF4105 domain-containing protein [Gemmatimonadota bacterium]NIV62434.1 DUF4105 domain-containing protein [Gemmatimonadota bacterium]
MGLLAATAPTAAAQELPAPLPSPPRLTAYLVTVGQGDAVWERFGHNLIWIHDPEAGTDQGYNYGLFSFRQENFLLNFVRGHMRYWMQGWSVRSQLAGYAAQGRTIWIQELALAPERVEELQAFLQWNDRPENRFYRYDYYRDNCSTRVRDALDRAVGGRLRARTAEPIADATWRDHTLRATGGVLWAWAGLHFAMGPMTDRPLTPWEEAFIPMLLQEHLRDVTVEGSGGEAVPVVRREWTWYRGPGPGYPDTTPRHRAVFWAVGLLVAGLIALLGARSSRDRRARLALRLLATPWLLIWGLFGLTVGLMWAFTDHVVATGNANLLYAGPLQILVALLPGSLLGGEGRAARVGRWAAWGAAALSVVGLAAEALPGIGQVNGEFLGLLIPANLAVAWVAWAVWTGAAEVR